MPPEKRHRSPTDEESQESSPEADSHQGSTSTVTHNPASSTPNSTVGPAGGPAHSASSSTPGTSTSAPGASTAASKRRRGLGVVTPNACTECRKKRAKCDGERPCGRCKAQKDVECVYEVPVRQSKENLRVEIDQLRRQKRTNDSVLSAIARTEQWEEVSRRLRNGQSVDSISEWLSTGVSGSGSGAGTVPNSMPTFARPSGIGSNFTPMANFHGVASSSFTPSMAHTMSVTNMLSPMTSAPNHSGRPGMDPNSPWGGQSSSNSHSTRSNSHPDTLSLASGPPQTRVGMWVDDDHSHGQSIERQQYRGLEQVLTPEIPDMTIPASTWTNITSDSGLVQHLLALYFCWEYPTFASLSKEHFLKDFQNGTPRYCSSILVNALLALGCRFSSQPSTRANPDDPYSSGDHFFQECHRQFHKEQDHHTLTTIQALGIMSIREASCGRDSESWYYAGQSIRLAIEMGLHRVQEGDADDEDEVAVQAATFWGAFGLDHAWSLATGSLPQSSCFPRLPPKPTVINDIESSLWVPYTDDGAPLQRSCEQPSNVRSVYKCFCELSELVHQSLYMLHSPGRPLTSRDLLNIYTQYLNWYDRIPEVLRLGHNFTPAVLFAHMYYHFAILLLFRPLIKLRIIGSSISPRDVCSQAADAIQSLLKSYSQLYTLRRTPSFVPYFVLTSSIMHLAIAAVSAPETKAQQASPGAGSALPQQQPTAAARAAVKGDWHVTDAINRGIADLTEMVPCHHFAEQALHILRYLAKKWNINVDMDVNKHLEEVRHEGGGGDEGGGMGKGPSKQSVDSIKTSGGLMPVTHSLNFFAPNVREQDYISTFGSAMPPPKASTTPPVQRTSDSMENPLFWPFPMQGRPMLPSGSLLKEAGFELL